MNHFCHSPTHPDTPLVSTGTSKKINLRKFEVGSQGEFRIDQLEEFFNVWHEKPVLTKEAASQVGIDFKMAERWVSVCRGNSLESLTEEEEPVTLEIPPSPSVFDTLINMHYDRGLLEMITEGESGFKLEFEDPVEVEEPYNKERENFCRLIMSLNIHYKANCLFICSANATCYARCDGVIHEREFKIYAAFDSNGRTRVTFERWAFGAETGTDPKRIQIGDFITKCISEFDFNAYRGGHLFLEETLAKQVTYLPNPLENSFILVPNSCTDLVPMKKFWPLLSLLVPDTELNGELFRTRIENLHFSIDRDMIKKLLSRPITKFKKCLKKSLLRDMN